MSTNRDENQLDRQTDNQKTSKRALRGFVSVSEAAKFLGVSPDTLRNWEASGKLIPARTEGGARRYSPAVLVEYKKNLKPLPKAPIGLTSVSKAAEELQVSPDTIRNWERKGIIKAERTEGGLRRFTRSEIKRLQAELNINPSQNISKNSTTAYPETTDFKKDIVLITDKPILKNTPSLSADFIRYPETAISENQDVPTRRVLRIKPLTAFLSILLVSFFGIALIFATKYIDLNKRLPNYVKTDNSFTSPSSKDLGEVLAESSPSGSFLQLNIDTQIKGSLSADIASVSGKLFADTVNTGFGDNEVYPMDQPLLIASTPSFASLTFTSGTNQIKLSNTTISTQTGGSGAYIASIPTLSANDDFVFAALAQTLTNKTISGSSNTFSNIPISALASSAITVSAGSGLSGGGEVSLGGSITISNSGVTSITGTANQVIASAGTGGVTLSLPQDIATTSDVEFDSLELTTGLLLNGSTSGTTTLAAAAATTSYTLTLPSTSGTSGYVLSTDGTGTTSWNNPSGLTIPWNSIDDPNGNQTLAMSTYTTNWSWTTGTSTNNLFNITSDNSANGTGSLVNIQTGTSSTLLPLRVRAGSTEALMVTASGNVGIGTTGPDALLVVSGGAAASTGNNINIKNTNASSYSSYVASGDTTNYGQILYGGTTYSSLAGTNSFNLFQSANAPMAFFTNGTNERMRITGGGNVGIGVTAPNAKFSIASSAQSVSDSNDTVYLEGPGANYTQVHLYNSTSSIGGYLSINASAAASGLGNTNGGLNLWTSTTHPIKFGTNSLERVRIASDGNVGIGTTAPIAGLHVYGSGQTSTTPTFPTGNQGGTLLVTDSGSAVGNGGMVMFGATSVGFAGIKGYLTNSTSNGIGDLVVMTRSTTGDTTLVERMRIMGNSAGNVGIGTSAPAMKLHILSTGESGLRVEGDSSGTARLDLYSSNANSGARNYTFRTDSYIYGDLNLAQSTARLGDPPSAGTSRIYIKNDGNVGIGTTAPGATFEVTGDVRISGLTASSGVYTDSNKQLTSTVPSSGALGYWTRTGTVLTTTTSGDSLSLGSTITMADNQWIGMGASAGRIEFDDQTVDEVNIINANVGIGTTTPAANLTIQQTTDTQGTGGIRSYNSAGTSSLAILQGADANTYIGNFGAGGMKFYTNSFGANGLNIQTNGNVGVGGITTVNRYFEVGTSTNTYQRISTTATNQDAALEFYDGTTTTFIGQMGANSCGTGLSVYNGGCRMIVTSSNVGIGDTTPDALLDLDSSATTTNVFGITNTGVFTGTGTSSVAQITANSATTGDILTISGTGLSTGQALTVTGTQTGNTGRGAGLVDIDLTLSTTGLNHESAGISTTVANNPSTNANIAFGSYTSLLDGTTLANTVIGNYTSTSSSNNAAKSLWGYWTDTISSSTTGDSLEGMRGSTSGSGALSGATTRTQIGLRSIVADTAVGNNSGSARTLYGIHNSVSTTTSTNGTLTIYGEYISTSGAHAADAGTINNYGLYVDNGTSSTNATSKKWGLFVVAQSGADENYGAYIASNVGIGTSAPTGPLQVQSNSSAIATVFQGRSGDNLSVLQFSNNAMSGQTLVYGSNVGIGIGTSTFNQQFNASSAYFSGNVGIGATSPSTKLQISGATDAVSLSMLSGGSTNSTYTTIGRTATDGLLAVVGTAGQFATGTTAGDIVLRSESGELYLNSGTSDNDIVISGNNVGIGITAPTSILHVSGTTGNGSTTFQSLKSGAYTLGNFDAIIGNTVTSSTASINKHGLYLYSTGTWNGSGASNIALLVEASGGTNNFQIYDNTTGANLSGGTWNNSSDRNLKENFTNLNGEELLGKIDDLPVTEWNYIGDPNTKHIGPVAQDFRAIFGLGNSEKTISTIDPAGIALAGIKALNQKVNNALIVLDPQGLASGNLEADKITVATDIVTGGLVSAQSFSLDASTLNRSGALASVPVSSEGKTTIADSLNSLNSSVLGLESRISNQESKEASDSAALSEVQQLSNSVIQQSNSLNEKVASTSANLASLSAQIQELLNSTADSTNSSTLPSAPDDGLTPPSELLTASSSATLANLKVTDTISTAKLDSENATVSSTFKALGDSFLGRTTVAGDLSVDGAFSVTEGSKINALPTLYLQNNLLAEKIDLFNGKVTINKDGTIQTATIITNQIKVNQNTSLGKGVITSGQTEVTIQNALIEQNSIVLITPEKPLNQTLAVSEQTSGNSFKVKMLTPENEDINFSYLIIGQQTP